MLRKIDQFNELVRLNEELIDYDIHLTEIQETVLEHIISKIEGSTASFQNDYLLFKDAC